MMQGDEYTIPVEIKVSGQLANGKSFEDVEMCIGRIRKTLSDGEISYSEDRKAFMFPLTQRETLLLQKGKQAVQIRVKMANGEVIGTTLPGIDVTASISKVVL